MHCHSWGRVLLSLHKSLLLDDKPGRLIYLGSVVHESILGLKLVINASLPLLVAVAEWHFHRVCLLVCFGLSANQILTLVVMALILLLWSLASHRKLRAKIECLLHHLLDVLLYLLCEKLL